ncbi:MAG TPA: tetratricopeptide repeat protein, partial [Terriglobales bacterium]|nr:tetratricopeptide repeat protein [Terriglobales bacterium]
MMAKQRLVGWAAGALLVMVSAPGLWAQQTGKTVHHLRVEDSDPMFPPELRQAEAELDKQNYSTAEPLLQHVSTQNPGNYRAWFDLGYLYTATGHKPEAIAAYRKAVAAKPDVFESNLNLGLMLAQERSPEAEQFLRAATQLKPSAHPQEGLERAWLSLGHVLESSKPAEAVQTFGNAARLQPKDPEPHLSAGAVLEKQKDWAGAEREYLAAAALAPQSADALLGLANVYMQDKRLPQAEDALRRYVALNPKNAATQIELGRILEAEGKHADAAAQLEQGLKLEPGDAAAQRDLAFAYANLGKFDKAEAIYRALLAKTPNDAELHYGLGTSLMAEHKYPEAQSELLNAARLKPDAGVVYGDLAVVAAENKNYMLSLKALDVRAKLLPENAGT